MACSTAARKKSEKRACSATKTATRNLMHRTTATQRVRVAHHAKQLRSTRGDAYERRTPLSPFWRAQSGKRHTQ